jgi:hypothetical protein
MAYAIDDGTITLSGPCGIEEVEALHADLCALHEPLFDLAAATTLHTAVVQLILAAGARVRNAPADPLFAACLRALPDTKESWT